MRVCDTRSGSVQGSPPGCCSDVAAHASQQVLHSSEGASCGFVCGNFFGTGSCIADMYWNSRFCLASHMHLEMR